MKTINIPKLTLIGAGPGDPELITLKGVKSLEKARVVLYDALVDKRLLNHAPNAIKIYVGKRAGKHSFHQNSIHKMIVKYAYEYGSVVRLKGGDSFVFGRGSEEIEYARLFGLETEVIPGISSAFAVPASLGIPATQRKISDGVWVITGTKSNGEISKDIHLAAQSNSTVVILMGTKKLPQIVESFKNAGKENLPIGIIQNGTTKMEKSVVSTVSKIEAVAKKSKMGAPAIIILGEVVKNAERVKEITNSQMNYN